MKALLHRLLLPLRPLVLPVLNRRLVRRWEVGQRESLPPAPVKQQIVREYGAEFGLTTLVETGTFLGDMIAACRGQFTRIFSIELDPELYRRASRRFRRCTDVTLLHGDSGTKLQEALSQVQEPCLFWLDAHYSAGITARADVNTPVVEELQTIFAHHVRDHVILIDDAVLFVGRNDYPTLETVRETVERARPGWSLEVRHDVIRIHPPRTRGDVAANQERSTARA